MGNLVGSVFIGDNPTATPVTQEEWDHIKETTPQRPVVSIPVEVQNPVLSEQRLVWIDIPEDQLTLDDKERIKKYELSRQNEQ